MSEPVINWDDYIQVASLSDVGMRRTKNQDNLSVSMATSMDHWERKGHLLVVADGMGAHAAGELASKIAIDQVPHLYGMYNDTSAPEAMKQAVQNANAEIHRKGQLNEEFHNMGTTCSCLNILPQGAVLAHIGDSRVYRLSNNQLEQLTFDHSLVWEMRANGTLSAEEEKSGKVPSNVITRSLGPYAECKVDLEGPFPVQVGDSFLLCSDGLTGVVSDTEIGSIMSNMDPDEAVQVLVDLANLRGGPDNITVIIAKAIHPKIATSNDPGNYFLVNSRKDEYQISPAWWGTFVAAICFACLLFLMNDMWTALLPLAVAISTGIFIGIRLYLGAHSGVQVTPDKRFGKGPYTRHGCASAPDFAKQIAAILNKLRKGAMHENWEVDWDQMGKMVQNAENATKAKDHSSSIRLYGRALSFMMEQLRNQGSTSSSSIDL